MLRFTRQLSITSRLLKANSPQITTSINPETNKETVKINPIERTGEPIATKRARLVYQSRKRGILETDLLLSGFSKKYLNQFSEAELDEYDKLLDNLDWDIYYWATRNYDVTPLPEEWKDSKVLQLLQDFSENRQREILRMPNLF